jgi:dihydroxyacetone kinase-like protein
MAVTHSSTPGGVFASPSTDQILAATRAASTGGGVLYVVKNYTGDGLNFRLAGDAARAEGIEVASVLVDDDVSVDGSDHTVGKRGTGATLFVHKIAGAVAAEGGSLNDVQAAAAEVVERCASFGIALTSPSLPGAEGPILALITARRRTRSSVRTTRWGRRLRLIRQFSPLRGPKVHVAASTDQLSESPR